MVFNKKAITPVVATALLLVVAVVAVVGFQTWFATYQSGLNTKVEQQSQTGTAITVERLESNKVYLKNTGTVDINASSISVGGTVCTNGITTVNKSTTAAYPLDITKCSSITKGTAYDVVVVTSDGVFQENEIAR